MSKSNLRTLETVGTIDTESMKFQRIQHAVPLESCKGNKIEQQQKIKFLTSIDQDDILDYLLATYVEPYSDYMAGRIPNFKRTAIDVHEFLKKTGGLNSTNNVLSFCLDNFYYSDEGDSK